MEDIKISLEDYRAVLYRFVILLATKDHITAGEFAAILSACQCADSIIEHAHKDGNLQLVIEESKQDESVAELMKDISQFHSDALSHIAQMSKKERVDLVIRELSKTLNGLLKD